MSRNDNVLNVQLLVGLLALAKLSVAALEASVGTFAIPRKVDESAANKVRVGRRVHSWTTGGNGVLPSNYSSSLPSSSSVNIEEDASPDELYWLSYASLASLPDLGRDIIVSRAKCSSDTDCEATNSACDSSRTLCHCPDGYFPKPRKSPGLQEPATDNQTFFCMRAASYGELCVSNHQCVIHNSVCSEPPINWSSSSASSSSVPGRLCLCRDGHFPGYGPDGRFINGAWFDSQVTCFNAHKSFAPKADLVMLTGILVILVAAIGLFVATKIKQRKRTGLSSSHDGSSSPGHLWTRPEVVIVANEPTDGSGPYGYGEKQPSPVPSHMVRDFMHLPPIGSAAAEFQNDFIQVFPMRHLEPQPEKNSHALRAQFEAYHRDTMNKERLNAMRFNYVA